MADGFINPLPFLLGLAGTSGAGSGFINPVPSLLGLAGATSGVNAGFINPVPSLLGLAGATSGVNAGFVNPVPTLFGLAGATIAVVVPEVPAGGGGGGRIWYHEEYEKPRRKKRRPKELKRAIDAKLVELRASPDRSVVARAIAEPLLKGWVSDLARVRADLERAEDILGRLIALARDDEDDSEILMMWH